MVAMSRAKKEDARFAREEDAPLEEDARLAQEKGTPLAQAEDRIDATVWKVAGVALFGALLAQLDATIVNVSLSNLALDLHTRLSTIQWVTSGYLLALTLVLPLNGWLVDRIGAKALYLWCFSAFTLCSALCGLAWSAPSLIAFRLLQGVSGGLLAPMAQLMVARVAGRHMTRVASYMSMPVLLAPVLGPVVAGAILQHASWRWLFLVNVPVGLVALVLVVIFLPADRHETTRRTLDWLGLLMLSPALALCLVGVEHGQAWLSKALLLAGLILLVAFIWHARRRGDRALIDLQLFRSPVFSYAAVTQFLTTGAMFAGQLLIPAYLIQACARSPGEMGAMLAPMGVGMLVTKPFMGMLNDRFGIRYVSAGGGVVMLLATIALCLMATQGLNVWVLIPVLLLRGMGLSVVGLPPMVAAYASVSRARLPMATTSLNIVQRLGGPVITTVCATFLAWRLALPQQGQDVSMAYAWAFLLLCGLHGLTVLTAWRLPRRIEDVVRRD